MNLFTKQKQTQTQKPNLWLPKGKGVLGGYIRIMELTDTKHYI